MRKCVRGSAFALAAALVAATAYAAWQPRGSLRSARLATPQVAANSIVAAMRAGNAPTERNLLDSPRQQGAPFDLVGCADAPAVGAAEFLPVCLDPAELDGSGALFAAASLGGFAFEFGDDPDPLYLTGLAPSALAAPTPEISTAAMLTLGFAGAAWTACRARRPALRPRLRPAIAAVR